MRKRRKYNILYCNIIFLLLLSGIAEYSTLLIKPQYIVITAAGDCTLGSYPEVAPGRSFEDVLRENGNSFAYPFQNTKEWFHNDDITIVNLEGTLTDAQVPAKKKWRFKGPQEYVNILTKGGIDGVNIANNHSFDYLKEGYQDTVAVLHSAGVGIFGNGYVLTKEIRGVKVAFLGYMVFNESEAIYKRIKEDIDKERDKGVNVVVCSFHWGIEYNNIPTKYQQSLGRYAIDSGADMIIGHHPHILQGIEEYKGRYIAYSLGNFVFGGNELLTDKKHRDIDTILLRQDIELVNNKVSKIKLTIIPFQISGDKAFNNYQPVKKSGNEAVRIRDKLLRISEPLPYGVKELNIK